jgi:hypothetical protein
MLRSRLRGLAGQAAGAALVVPGLVKVGGLRLSNRRGGSLGQRIVAVRYTLPPAARPQCCQHSEAVKTLPRHGSLTGLSSRRSQ